MSNKTRKDNSRNKSINRNTSTTVRSNSANSQQKKRKGKRKKKKSIPLIIGSTLLLIALSGVTFIGTFFLKSMNDLNTVELDKSQLGIADHDELSKYDEYDKIKNILILGTDQTTDSTEPIRSDAMMLLTVDPIHNKLKVTSFMRDTRVRIDGHGEEKLTHAYVYGGAQLTIKTLNENFGLNIEEFVSVDFTTLPKIIDLLGGVEINITPEEFNDVNNVIFMDNRDYDKSNPYLQEPGLQVLSGNQALSYARNRSSAGGDYARTERQRTVIEALFKKGLSTSVTSYPSILSEVLPYVTTNMSSGDILNLGKNILASGSTSLQQARFPVDESSWGAEDPLDKLWYLYHDAYATKKQVQDYIFDDVPPPGYE